MPPLPDPGCNGPVRLPAHCSTVAADELRIQLVIAADHAATIAIDASEVETIGQAVLQLLIAARAEAGRNGGVLALERPSAAFAERVTRCGLAGAIGLTGDQFHDDKVPS